MSGLWEFLQRWAIIGLWKMGLYTFDPERLHQDYLMGELDAGLLLKLLDPGRIQDFIEYHSEIKGQFEASTELNSKGSEMLTAKLREYIENDPLLSRLLAANNGMLFSNQDRRRMFFALSQIDRLIEEDLEKLVNARQGKRNIVRRAN